MYSEIVHIQLVAHSYAAIFHGCIDDCRGRNEEKGQNATVKTSQQTYQYNGLDRSGSDIHISLCAM